MTSRSSEPRFAHAGTEGAPVSSPTSSGEGTRARVRAASVVIHSTALVDPRAELAEGVVVGPYCVIGPDVTVGRESVLLSHVSLSGPTTLGTRCTLHPFCVVGGTPQVRYGAGDFGSVVLGDEVVVREHVTVHRGTQGRPTRVGSRVLLMVGAHVGHDAEVGNDVVVANGVQLAGHAIVEDFVTFGGLAGVAQRVKIGESAFVAAGAMCEVDVPPFVIVQGDRARVRALNKVGLSRRGVPKESIVALERAFRDLFVRRGITRKEAALGLDPGLDPWVARLRESLLPPSEKS